MSGTRRNFNFFFPRQRRLPFGLTQPCPNPLSLSAREGPEELFKTQSRAARCRGRRVSRISKAGSFFQGEKESTGGGKGNERGEYTRNIVNNARYNAPQAHFISYCRELRHGT